jgi:S1-C subfamily serine protease
MKFLAGILIALLAWPVFASEKITTVTIDGKSYKQIQDVQVINGGRVVILFASGGTSVAADKLPTEFLASWGITAEALAASKIAAEKQAEQSLAQAIRAGYFRQVDGVVYDLRKPQTGWRQFSNARILQVIEGGALVEPEAGEATPTAVFVRNLPRLYADNDRAAFKAKLSGEFTYANKFGYERTIHAYDVGRVCQRNEIPDSIIHDGLAAVSVPMPDRLKEQEHPASILPDSEGLRGIGSGFFISSDGYLLSNFHVIKGAGKIEVKYKTRLFSAKVIQVDAVNDVALLKVRGAGFVPLAISRKDSADLGDAVFTIGFPNIDLQGLEPKYTDGKISSLTGIRDDPSEYQISVPVQPGNSGGPLCDAEGEVVGIVVARLNDLAALRESGAVPQNVNYAVKAKHVLHLLQSVKGLDALLMPAKTAAKPAKPVQAVADAIAMIMVY